MTDCLRPTSPSECAIAVALPLTFDQFYAEQERWPDSDFARSFVRRYSHSAETIWDSALSAVAGRTMKILAEVGELGVHIRWSAGLGDLAQLFEGYRAVTLLTHWRSGRFFPDHILNADSLRRRIAVSKSRAGQLLRNRLGQEERLWLTDDATPDEFAIRFSRAVNQVLEQFDLGPSGYPPGWHSSHNLSYRVHANRAVLDAEFGADLVPGNRVQLCDGMRTARELAAVVPAQFDGVFDLTVCNSVMIAEEVKRNGRVTCLANEKEVDLALRMEIYRGAVQVLSQSNYEYSNAIRDVRIALVAQIERKRGRSLWSNIRRRLWNGKLF